MSKCVPNIPLTITQKSSQSVSPVRYVEEPVLNQNHNEQDNDDLRRNVRFSSNTPGLAVLKSIGVQDESGMAKSEVPRPVPLWTKKNLVRIK